RPGNHRARLLDRRPVSQRPDHRQRVGAWPRRGRRDSVVRSHRRVSRGDRSAVSDAVAAGRSPIMKGVTKPVARGRIDRLLVERVDKAGALVAREASVEVQGRTPFVGRGGEKLVHALDAFQMKVAGRVCLDVGASTGGFTDCLLQRGAARVYAVDVGTGQLDVRLRKDPRVVVMEKTNARALDPRIFGEQPTLAVIDVSFISLEKILPSVFGVLAPRGEVVA